MHFKLESPACALAATLACTFLVSTSCGPSDEPEAPSEAVGTVQAALSYSYSATNTNNAQQNTVDQTISLTYGDEVEIGTCGLTGASGTGDTYLRLMNTQGTEGASADDGCPGLLTSYFKFTVPPGGTGNYTVRGGCFSSGSCSGTVVWQVTPAPAGTSLPPGGYFTFNAINTNYAQQSTQNRSVALTAGQLLKVGTCVVRGSKYTNDTILRLFGPSSTEVASNDDLDPTNVCSYLAYTVPTTGTYEIRVGCYSSNACSGTVAYTIE
jgi:hypothetical protein